LADANVAVYPVDSRGVDVGFPGADSKVDPSGIPKGKQDMAEELVNTNYWLQNSMRDFADLTGARVPRQLQFRLHCGG